MTSLLFKRDLARCFSYEYHEYCYPLDVVFAIKGGRWSRVIDESRALINDLRIALRHTIQRDMTVFEEVERRFICYTFSGVFSTAVSVERPDIAALLAPYCSYYTFWKKVQLLCEVDKDATDMLEKFIDMFPQYPVDWSAVLSMICSAHYDKRGFRLAIRRGATWCANCHNKRHPEIPLRSIVFQI